MFNCISSNKEGVSLTLDAANAIVLPQDTDIAPRHDDTPLASLLLTTIRSQEAAAGGLSNEDYITYRHDEQHLTLVVCDGVGQSFFGELAARHLGDKLLDWLWALPPGSTADGKKQAERLFNNLHSWTEAATALVNEYTLPKSKNNTLLQKALERKRKYGSACVFACAHIEVAEVAPDSNNLNMLALWLGNTRLRFWDFSGTEIHLAEEHTSNEQWSSARGPLNSDVVHHLSLQGEQASRVRRLTLHTDGLHQYADQLAGLTQTRLQDIVDKLSDDPASDDISLLDATFTNSVR